MHVSKFYPHTMHRSWAVMDTNGRPHSLWIYRSDAEEMESWLADLSPIRSTYQPLNTTKETKPWQQ